MKRWILLFSLFFLFMPASVSAAEPPTTVKIPVVCDSEGLDDKFTYVIVGDTRFIRVSPKRLVLKDGMKDYFTLTFTKPGVYHYKVKQMKHKRDTVASDTNAYQVDVYVEEAEDGSLNADPIIYVEGKSTKKLNCLFANAEIIEDEAVPLAAGPAKTGDEAKLSFWFHMMAVSGIGFCLLAISGWHIHKTQA